MPDRTVRPFVFGEDRQHFRMDYDLLAEALADHLEFQTTIDIGAGQGWLTEDMLERGKEACGIEIDSRALPHMTETAKSHVQIGDFLSCDLGPETYDLVTCIEVAGHILPQNTDRMADVLADHASWFIALSAETPNQPGDGHINCRPHFHWIDRLAARGFTLDITRTRQVQDHLAPLYRTHRAFWIQDNILIFRRTP